MTARRVTAWRMLLPPIRERIRPKQENNHV